MKEQISVIKRRIESFFYIKRILFAKRRIIVVTGCGRSGTTYSSKWLAEAGLSIGHERLRADGISSWYLVSDSKQVPLGPSYYFLRNINKLVIHQVREPLAAISSMQATGGPSWEFISNEIPIDIMNDSKVLKAMKYYYYWNLKAEKIAGYTVKVEHFDSQIREIFNKEGVEISKTPNVNEQKKVNTRKHVKLNKNDLLSENQELALKIFKLAEKYGYVY